MSEPENVIITTDWNATLGEQFHRLSGMLEMLPNRQHYEVIQGQVDQIINLLNGSTIVQSKQYSVQVRDCPYKGSFDSED